MIALKKKQEDEYMFETRDILIAFDDDQRTSDICTITSIDHESVIVAGKYKVPLKDCVVTTGLDGRNFFYKAPTESITETRRLAELEQSMVLSQITAYTPPQTPSSMDWLKFSLIFMLVVCIIGLMIK